MFVSCIMCVFSSVFVLDLTAPSSLLYHLGRQLCLPRHPWESQRTPIVESEQDLSIQDFITIFLLGYNSEQYSKYNNYEVVFLFRIFIISKKSFKCY